MALPTAHELLFQESQALEARLSGMKFFALHEPMVPAANLSPAAQIGIDRHLAGSRRRLQSLIDAFVEWLQSTGASEPPPEVQRRFTFLRMRFNAVLAEYEIFASAVTQRSEHDNGVWLAGLDVAAADALRLPLPYYTAPPVICYLDRGFGAAIRRARTRLPGGGRNPVAIIRIPRERMVGSGIAASLVHEVGHQGAALLDLIASLLPELDERVAAQGYGSSAWALWRRWVSEIVADLWAVSRIGVGASLGLMNVVSLPRAFVFRIAVDDPHPVPWIRVKLSCVMGNKLYPHPQWPGVSQLWEELYPLEISDPARRDLFEQLLETMPAFVDLLLAHAPASLRGATLGQVLADPSRRPRNLDREFEYWLADPARRYRVSPSLAFATAGQARLTGRLSPDGEATMIGHLLRNWALRRTLRPAEQ